MAKIATPTAFTGTRMDCIFSSPTNGSTIAAIRKITASTTPTPAASFRCLRNRALLHMRWGQPGDWPREGLQPVSDPAARSLLATQERDTCDG